MPKVCTPMLVVTVLLFACARRTTGGEHVLLPQSLETVRAVPGDPSLVAWLDTSTVALSIPSEGIVGQLDVTTANWTVVARRGQGPGEVTLAEALVSVEGGVAVHDVALRSLSLFDSTGTYQLRLPAPKGNVRLIGSTDRGLAWLHYPMMADTGFPRLEYRAPADTSGSSGPLLGPAISELVHVITPGLRDWETVTVLPGPQGTLAIASPVSGELRILDTRELPDIRIVLPPRPRIELSDNEKDSIRARLGRAAQRRGASGPSAEVLQYALTRPKPVSRPTGWALLETGEILIARRDDTSDSTRVEWRDATGALCGVLVLRDQVTGFAVYGRRLAVLVLRAAARADLPGLDFYDLPPAHDCQ